jgi:hypothetical protein
MTSGKELEYTCLVCKFFYDERADKCSFRVGPYMITMFSETNIQNIKLIISKGWHCIYVQTELPCDVEQNVLDQIWKGFYAV